MSKRKKRFPTNQQPMGVQGSRIAPGVLPGVSPDQLEGIRCGNCQGIHFAEATVLKLASRFQSANGMPTLVAFKVGFRCSNCGEINTYDHPDLQKPPEEKETGKRIGGSMSEVPEEKKIIN